MYRRAFLALAAVPALFGAKPKPKTNRITRLDGQACVGCEQKIDSSRIVDFDPDVLRFENGGHITLCGACKSAVVMTINLNKPLWMQIVQAARSGLSQRLFVSMWNCDHPWHEIGCPHRQWTAEELSKVSKHSTTYPKIRERLES